MTEQMQGVVKPQRIYIFLKGHSNLFFQQGGKVRGGQPHMGGSVISGDVPVGGVLLLYFKFSKKSMSFAKMEYIGY